MKKKILPVLALLIVMLLCAAAPARAASGTITEYHQVAYGVMRVGHFEINGQTAFCTDHDKTTPPRGTAVTTAGTVTNQNMRKALYYGYGGPASVVGADDRGWTLTSIAVSLAKGTATTHNSEMIEWYNEVIQRPAPPDGFVVTLWDTGNGSQQQLATWTWTPEGTLRVLKETDDAGLGEELLSQVLSSDGTVFTVTDASGKTAGTLTVKNGQTQALTLAAGTYTVRETSVPAGFALSGETVTVRIEAGKEQKVTFVNRPLFEPLDLLLKKQDEDGNPLEGAVFEVSWYRELFEDPDEAQGKTPLKTWTFETDAEGCIRYDAEHLVEGELLLDREGNAAGLPGTYVFRETMAPAGYAAADPVAVTLDAARIDGTNVTFAAPLVTDALQRVTIRIRKEDAVTQDELPGPYGTFEGAVFEIFRYDAVLDRDVSCGLLTTNGSGEAQTDPLLPGLYEIREVTPPAGYLAMKGAVTIRAGVKEPNIAFFTYEAVVRETPVRVLIRKMSYDKEGSLVPLEGAQLQLLDAEGTVLHEWTSTKEGELFHALPAGTYTVREIRTPEGYLGPQEDLTVNVTEQEEIQEIVFVNEKIPRIVTDASFEAGLKTAPLGVLRGADRVHLEDLVPGRTYEIRLQLLFTESGEQAGLGTTLTFRASGTDERIEVPFTVPENAAGELLTVTETLYSEGREIASHTDLRDKAQTVSVMRVQTRAIALPGEEKMLASFGRQTVADDLHIEGALPGHTYTAVMSLADTQTGEILRGASGKMLQGCQTFTAQSSDLTVRVILETEDASVFASARYTVIEQILEEETVVAEHRDLDSPEQTLDVAHIGTTLSDSGTVREGTTTLHALTDTVAYSGLVPDRDYTLSGTLHDAKSGKPLESDGKAVTVSVVFRPQQPEGTQDVLFLLPAEILAGRRVVAFEELSFEGRTIAVHADLKDAAQTVSFATVPKTGDDTFPALPALACAAGVSGGTAAWIIAGRHRAGRKTKKRD